MFLSGITIQNIVILIIILLSVFGFLFFTINKLIKRTKFYQNKIENKGIIKIGIFHILILISSLLIISLLIYVAFELSFE
ncbi:hypothetical protein SAMN04488096_1362 [Mesonia phycicola]|uniref:Uncharacterized protein n=1 Tax=Mesonia phycicola TaxID=579105 RepID=A0A1M6I0D5_9FLAO|nr:hypothetical protein SAMN04488096_1362 [Mesonia phycicola]